VDAEGGIGIEIDPPNICCYRIRAERRSEAQSYVVRVEAQQVIEQFRPRRLVQALNGDSPHPAFRASWRRQVSCDPGRLGKPGARSEMAWGTANRRRKSIGE